MRQKKERKHFNYVSESSPKAIILFCVPSNKSLNHKIGTFNAMGKTVLFFVLKKESLS